MINETRSGEKEEEQRRVPATEREEDSVRLVRVTRCMPTVLAGECWMARRLRCVDKTIFSNKYSLTCDTTTLDLLYIEKWAR